MEEKREIVCRYVGAGLKVCNAVRIAGIKKSTYYYRPNGRLKGKRPSTHTIKYSGEIVSNETVVQAIIDLISPEYNDYGYQVSTALLKRNGYIINHKKVYRLMRDNNLLHPQPVKKRIAADKLFIKYTVPPLEGPFVTIEADIKYVYIHGENRNAFLLTFLCTFCRYAPVWELQYSMDSARVIDLVMELVDHPVVKRHLNHHKAKVIIRTDNGPQFIAKKLACAFEPLGLAHEFINPGTPQQNGHIESFHSTVTRLVCKRNIFDDLDHAKSIFKEFFYAYNNVRVMRALLHNSPKEFLKLWHSGLVGIKKDKRNREIFFSRERSASILAAAPSPEELFELNKTNILDHTILND